MENFIVSARKYRPKTFEDVVGQKAITDTLEHSIANNHLAQALLFTGPRGVGKTTCARILAKKEKVSINQLITNALAEKLAALDTEEYLKVRAQQGELSKFKEALSKVADTGPDEYDRL